MAFSQSKELNKPLSYQITAMLNFISAELKHSSLITHDQVRLWIHDCEEYINLYQKASFSPVSSTDTSASETEQPTEQSLSPFLDNNSYVSLLFHVGLLYDRIGNYYKSVKSFEKVVNLNYDHLLAWLNIGNYFFKIRDFSQAIYYYSIGYNISLEVLNGKYSQHSDLSVYDPFFRSDYYNILSITNNLGQSYREQGQLRQSLSIFLSSYHYSKIMHIMNNPIVENDELTLNMGSDIVNSPEIVRLMSSRRKKQSKISLYTLITMYTIKGLLNDWKEYEYLEEFIKQQITYYQDDIGLSFLSTSSISDDSVFRYPLAHSENGNSIFDPYTLSLLPSVNADFDFFICQQNCPVQDLTSLNTTATGLSSSTTSSSLSYYLYNSSVYQEKRQEVIHHLSASASEFSSSSIVSDAPVNPVVIRIGYLSFDWRDHPMGRLTAAITTLNSSLSNLSSKSDVIFEIYCFSYGFHDTSEIRYFIEKHCYSFLDLYSLRKSDYELSQVIASYSIDLLYDITSHTYHNRMKILSFRPVPIIINYLGFPGTTGCTSNHFVDLSAKREESDIEGSQQDYHKKPIDLLMHYPAAMEYNFTIVDLFVAPPDYVIQRKSVPRDSIFSTNTSLSLYYKVFSEKLIYLPFSYQANYMPLTVFHRFPMNRRSLMNSLAERKIRACILNSGKKFEPTFFHTLTNILQRFPHLLLSFLDITSQSQEEIIKQLAFYGILASSSSSAPIYSVSSRRRRISFLSRESWKSHLIRIQEECDIVLDTFIYGGHTTSTDVLWMGIPIITLRGYGLSNGIRMPSRIASSLIENIDETIDKTNSTQVEVGKKRGYKFSDLLTYDSIKDYENGLIRLSLFQPATQRVSSLLSSSFSNLLFPSPLLIQLIQNRILSISCFSPIFNKEVMNEIFLYKYQLLFERYLYHEFIFPNLEKARPIRQYHYVILKESIMALIEKKGKYNYCLSESQHLLSLIEERKLSLHGENNSDDEKKMIVNEKNPLSFHMKIENLLSYDGWLKRLSHAIAYTVDTNDKEILDSDGIEIRKIKNHISFYRHQHLLSFYNLSELIPPTVSEQSLEPLANHVITVLSIVDSSPPRYDDYPVSSLLTILLDAIHFEFTKSDDVDTSVSSIIVSNNWFLFLNVFQKMLMNCINNEMLKVSQSLFLNLELPFMNYVFPKKIIPLSELPLSSSSSELLLFIENVNWEEIRSNLEKPSISSSFSFSFRHLLFKIFLNSYYLIFESNSLSSSSAFSFPSPPASSLVFQQKKKFLIRSHVDSLIQLLSSNFIVSDIIRKSLLQEFFQQYSLLMFYEEDYPKLYEIIFQFGVYWTSFTKDTRINLSLDLSIGYLFQSIGNRLMLSSWRASFLSSLSMEEEEKKHRLLQEKENKVFDYNPVIVFYCYEYGQEWWPRWGPSSFDSSLHTRDIPSAQQQYEQNLKDGEEGKAIGGSEEAVVYLAYELAKFGYNIEIYTDIPLEDRYFTSYQSPDTSTAIGRVQWFHYLDFNISRSIDVFISWRYALSLSLSINCQRKYLWLHDLVPKESLLSFEKLLHSPSDDKKDENGMIINGIFVQSLFHKQYIRDEYKKLLLSTSHISISKSSSLYSSEVSVKRVSDKVMILPNGVRIFSPSSLEDEERIENDSNIFIYSSSPNHGLEIVLHLWKYILSINSSAQLWIFYGFTSKVIDHLTQQMTKEAFLPWYERIQSLLKQPGIIYYGAVSHNELANYMKKGGFLLYPSSFPETGCITMMKAMIAGIIPITSHYSNSVLAELGEEFDFGPHYDELDESSVHISGEVHPFLNHTYHRLTTKILLNGTLFHNWATVDYFGSVVAAIDFAIEYPEHLQEIRKQMKKKMTKKFSWKNSAKLIKDYIKL
jgi:glycosyltransferase involved in cell wall biosynthesis/tetratricopeptide (TPR) repeat protein